MNDAMNLGVMNLDESGSPANGVVVLCVPSVESRGPLVEGSQSHIQALHGRG